MATDAAAQPEPQIALESGTYEIIRNRLSGYGRDLRERLAQLNEARKEVFGSIDLALLGTERITTAHNCTPRDMVAVGGRFLFGYNVHFGLKTERDLADVFAVYEFKGRTFHELPLDLIRDERFEKDFKDVYRYYKDAVFAKFFSSGPFLYIVFRVGKDPADIKTFKWAVQGEQLTYVDNRSDHEVRYPPQHEFQWTRTHRDLHQSGLHPHISIKDRVFVETVGGDLTIKIEDNTDTGEGIYSEPVANPDQTLDDAEVYYATLGNIILLKIRPYQEPRFRYFVYNEKILKVVRLDAIADACVLLPDDHGLIFSNGYYLQTGEHKTFESSLTNMLFERRIASPNGEDHLYVFYNRDSGDYVLLTYNVIAQKVETPLVCHGFTLFHGGELILFKAQHDAQKHHAVQIWQTPYVGEDFVPATETDSYLFKVGNRDIVRAMAECHEVLSLIDKEDTYAGLYLDLVKESTDVLDSYFWVDREEAFQLSGPLKQIRESASAAINEFDKVVRVKESTAAETRRVQNSTREILAAAGRKRFETIGDFVASLADLRRVRGEIISLRELRYVDAALVDQLEGEVAEAADRLSRRCVEFLLRPDSLKPYIENVQAEHAGIDGLTKVADARKVEQQIDSSASELEMLIEIVSNLDIEDATQRTTIIDSISAIFTHVNQARAALKRKTKELASAEGVAEFASQMKLLNQSVVNYLDVCDTPEKCEEYLTKVMIQLEELEGRFAEFDEFVLQLTEKREEVYGAFETKKLALVEARNKRAGALAAAADRVLKGIKSRVESFESTGDIHGYFASDLMIEKVRDIVRQLAALDDSVKVDDIQSRLKTIREDAVRQLKDRQELYVGGENVIKLGQKQFNVNVQALDLTTVFRDDRLCLHLTGTNFFEPVADPDLDAARDVWQQDVVSENRQVYRGEYLAYQIFRSLRTASNGNLPTREDLRRLSDDDLVGFVQRFMAPRYSEGYTKGVHDHDAAKILRALLDIDATIGLLRFPPASRALAQLFWRHFGDAEEKDSIATRLAGFGTVTRLFPGANSGNGSVEPDGPSGPHLTRDAKPGEQGPDRRSAPTGRAAYIAELRQMLAGFVVETGLFSESLLDEAAEYLLCELTNKASAGSTPPQAEASSESGFAISRPAARLHEAFHAHLKRHNFSDKFSRSIAAVDDDANGRYRLLRDWVDGFLQSREGEAPAEPSESRLVTHDELADYADELAVLLDARTGLAAATASSTLAPPTLTPQRIVDATISHEIVELAGTHAVIEDGRLHLHYNRFLTKLDNYSRHVVPRFERYVARKKELVEHAREDLRLDEFRPRVLTSFVRNRLLDTVYLPLIGDNLAKQIGEAGEGKRTDRMGLLLLISPPGYGKTTLMEYVANRLGVIFMKINGPALGHAVTSLDPAAAPNAGAREEVERLNLAFEMGDNVMIYLDDIQHTNPELLQKFISLCDATRKIEGVYKGKTRTYDFRGRKVAVVMAGNPYTESGEKFQIPDMLANRADVYNLGEIIGDAREAFESSYLENAVGSNPVLAGLAARSQKDVYAVIKMAERDSREGVELEGNYSLEELNEMVAAMRKLMRVRNVVLTVNREYIRSAAQAEEYRTEPPFKLQGSYRNMNRIAERVLPVMNDAELESLIMSSYENDAQTLTTGTEANLLKFKELLGKLTPAERDRWEHIKRAYTQTVKLKGVGTDDKFGQAIVQLSTFGDGLDAIRRTLTDGITRLSDHNGREEPPLRFAPEVEEKATEMLGQLRDLRGGLERIGEALAGSFSRLTELAAGPDRRLEPRRGDGDSEKRPDGPSGPAFDRDLLEQLAEDLRTISAAAVGARGLPVADVTTPADDTDSDDGADQSAFGGPAGPSGRTAVPIHSTPGGEQRITIVNKLPRTMMQVLERQFELMQNWLAPLLQSVSGQREELQSLRQSLEACLADYELLVGRLEQARGRKPKA